MFRWLHRVKRVLRFIPASYKNMAEHPKEEAPATQVCDAECGCGCEPTQEVPEEKTVSLDCGNDDKAAVIADNETRSAEEGTQAAPAELDPTEKQSKKRKRGPDYWDDETGLYVCGRCQNMWDGNAQCRCAWELFSDEEDDK